MCSSRPIVTTDIYIPLFEIMNKVSENRINMHKTIERTVAISNMYSKSAATISLQLCTSDSVTV